MNTTKISVEENLLIINNGQKKITIKEENRDLLVKNYNWIYKFLAVKTNIEGYEILLLLNNGNLAKWHVDTIGVKKNFQAIKNPNIFDIASDFKVEIKKISPYIEQKVNGNEKAKFLFEKSQAASNTGDFEQAASLLGQAILMSENNYKYLQELARVLSIEREFSQALEIYLFCAIKYPQKELNFWHFKHNIITYFKQTKDKFAVEECIGILNKILTVTKNTSNILDLLGDLYWEIKEESKALELKVNSSTQKAIKYKNLKYIDVDQKKINYDSLRFPDFLVVGAQKTGTTALYQYITDHPNIFRASNKEIFFFDLKYHYGINWYKSHFPKIENYQYITGEASATYFNSIEAAERIAKTLPNVKIILIIRDPVDRAISDYYMKVRDGLETREIQQAIFSEIDYLEKNQDDACYTKGFLKNHQGYVRNGMYYYFLKKYWKIFPQKNIFVIKAECLREKPQEMMMKIFDFLNVKDFCGHYPIVNSGKYNDKNHINIKVRDRLSLFFRKYNELLEKLLDCDLEWQ